MRQPPRITPVGLVALSIQRTARHGTLMPEGMGRPPNIFVDHSATARQAFKHEAQFGNS